MKKGTKKRKGKVTKKSIKSKKSNKSTTKNIFDMEEVKSDMESIKKRIAPYLNGAKKTLKSAGKKTSKTQDETSEKVSEYVKEHPIEAISIAFLAGFFLASLKK